MITAQPETFKQNKVIEDLVTFLVKGKANIAVTGQQGVGKNTYLYQLLSKTNESAPILVGNVFSEKMVHNTLPHRSTLMAKKDLNTEAIHKNIDHPVVLVGEVPSAKEAEALISTALRSSENCLFSHHASSTKALRLSMRNLMVELFGYSLEGSEALSSELVNFNVHLSRNFANGERYVDFVSEVVQGREEESPMVYFDHGSQSYKLGVKMTPSTVENLMRKMDMKDAADFDSFLAENWGE